ncbi:LysE/ArgO family amino acid transporter [Bifidobacterium oedipodis]|uniref:L-lysine permease n=1 Tax=Bifidobacterium oedipodis TaxID=2675322 RepID=A0A7Y0EQE0_9BIFI|nr:LysE family transporter [Bifidobacterium sp. DSM 109957]NMM94529.1 L-lysine permease [Bifidobacterium sp. DSM 109957]
MGLYLQGLTVGLAYIAPIGMQNLFVINTALTKPRRRALLTALFVTIFDVMLSLACFFGIGTLMQRYTALKLVVLAAGGLVVIRIGLGLLLPKRNKANGGVATSNDSASSTAVTATGLRGWLHTIGTACVVTWCNPQAIIDGTLMLGAFAASLSVGQTAPFITGVETASVCWFTGLTLVVSAFSHAFGPRLLAALNKVCGAVICLYGVKLLVDFALAVL